MQLIKLVECKEHLETNMYKIMYSQLVIMEKWTQKSWSEPKCEAHYTTTYLINEYMNKKYWVKLKIINYLLY